MNVRRKNLGSHITNKKGLSLVEVLFSVLFISTAVASSLLYFSSAQAATALAKDTTIATNHATYILEEMRMLDDLATVTDTNWDDFVSINNLNDLMNEDIEISFVDTSADPLNVTITVNWTTHTRQHNLSMETEITKWD